MGRNMVFGLVGGRMEYKKGEARIIMGSGMVNGKFGMKAEY